MYLLFCGMYYYPSPGIDDLVGNFDMYNTAFNALLQQSVSSEWGVIYNPETEEVWKFHRKGPNQEWEEYSNFIRNTKKEVEDGA